MRKGVCQDFAHVMIGALRSMGARCVVRERLPRDAAATRQSSVSPAPIARTLGSGCTSDDGRWIGVDPTNDQIAGLRYVTAARGRDYADVPPLKGVIFTDAEESRLTVSVDVAAQ